MKTFVEIRPGWGRWAYLAPMLVLVLSFGDRAVACPLEVSTSFGLAYAIIFWPLCASLICIVAWPSIATWWGVAICWAAVAAKYVWTCFLRGTIDVPGKYNESLDWAGLIKDLLIFVGIPILIHALLWPRHRRCFPKGEGIANHKG